MVFAAKVRGARAILGWSQRDLGRRVSLTQKSVYKMEQGTHGLRRSTVATVERVLKAEGSGFKATILARSWSIRSVPGRGPMRGYDRNR